MTIENVDIKNVEDNQLAKENNFVSIEVVQKTKQDSLVAMKKMMINKNALIDEKEKLIAEANKRIYELESNIATTYGSVRTCNVFLQIDNENIDWNTIDIEEQNTK